MADRLLGAAWRLYADLGAVGLTGTVLVTDPLGTPDPAGPAAFREVGGGRYTVTLPLQARVEGLWTADWVAGLTRTRQAFTVARDDPGTQRLADTRVLTALRVGKVQPGRVTSAAGIAVADVGLVGGSGEFTGCWVVPDPASDLAGMVRHVVGFDGAALDLDADFPVDPAPGAPYWLFAETLAPAVIDVALGEALHALCAVAYCPLGVAGLHPDLNGVVSVPAGWDYVTDLYTQGTSGAPTRLAPHAWYVAPGRTLVVAGSQTSDTLTLRGARDARLPVWEDSLLDLDPLVLAVLASHLLHLPQAGGPATDYDAHLGRSAALLQEYGIQLTTRLRRPPRNLTRLID